MGRIIKKINTGVSVIILAIFYLFFIGLGYILYRLFVPRKRKETKTYWEKIERAKKESFLSPY